MECIGKSFVVFCMTCTSSRQVDLNRAGVPLVEVVSAPDMRTGVEAAEYAAELQRLVRDRSVALWGDRWGA